MTNREEFGLYRLISSFATIDSTFRICFSSMTERRTAISHHTQLNLVFKYYRLQQIDSQLDQLRARLSEIETILQDNSELNKANRSRESFEAALEKSRARLRKAELETSSQRDKVRDSERQLYGGKVTNPKELQDLQREVEALKRHLQSLEDQEFDRMVEVETAQQSTEEAMSAVNDIQARTVERKAALQGEKTTLESEVKRFNEERKAAIISLDPTELERYEKLRRQKRGVAVARVIDKTCSACGSTLSAAMLQSAQSPNEIANCNSCGRMLYGG